MRLKLTSIMALILLIFSSFWLGKTLYNQRHISGLYIVKKPCDYRSNKSVIIYFDEQGLKSLKRFNISAADILGETNKIWKSSGVKIQYNLKELKYSKWDTSSKNCKFSNAKFVNEKWCLANEMGPRARIAKKFFDPDILIFITANGIDEMSGKSFWEVNQGNGTIVLNLGINLQKYDSDDKVKNVAERFYRKRFAQLLIHEHAHLYGVPHSEDPYSIMKENLDELGSHKISMDKKSKAILFKRTGQLERGVIECAARK